MDKSESTAATANESAAATTTQPKEVDYLIVGGGAMGVAFCDEIIHSDPTATCAIVDRRRALGGHWNDAYPYARLHQPACYYGVNSLKLEKRVKNGEENDNLSSKSDILEYYARLLTKFQDTGRVHFWVSRRLVNATYMDVQVPSTHAPKFDVHQGVTLIPPNDLPDHCRSPVAEGNKWDRYYILGNGKTGIDAVVYLLRQGAPPESIHWIMPTDTWCWIRSRVQTEEVLNEMLRNFQACVDSPTALDMFLTLERQGSCVRIDPSVTPTKWRCATISEDELGLLRQVIPNVIRHGWIQQITTTHLKFQSGATVVYNDYNNTKALFVNCRADGLAKKPAVPIFSPGRLDLQSIVFCQQVFSASILAQLELLTARGSCCRRLSNEHANKLVKPVLHPTYVSDWPSALSQTVDNVLALTFCLPRWLSQARLYLASHAPSVGKYLSFHLQAALLSPVFGLKPELLRRRQQTRDGQPTK